MIEHLDLEDDTIWELILDKVCDGVYPGLENDLPMEAPEMFGAFAGMIDVPEDFMDPNAHIHIFFLGGTA
jgi:hypothetical protein